MSTLLDELESDLQIQESFSGVPLYTLELSGLSEGDQLHFQQLLEIANSHLLLSEEIAFLKIKTDALEASLAVESSEKEDLKNTLAAAEDSIAKNAESISSESTETDSKVAELSDTIEANKEAAEASAANSSAEISALEAEVDALTSKLAEQESKLAEAEAEAAEEKAAREALEDLVASENNSLSSTLKESLEDEELARATLEAKVDAEIANIKDSAATEAEKVADLETSEEAFAKTYAYDKSELAAFQEGVNVILEKYEVTLLDLGKLAKDYAAKLEAEAQLSDSYQADFDATSLADTITMVTEWPAGTVDDDGLLAEYFPWMTLP